jgi:terminal uridylyltransferase
MADTQGSSELPNEANLEAHLRGLILQSVRRSDDMVSDPESTIHPHPNPNPSQSFQQVPAPEVSGYPRSMPQTNEASHFNAKPQSSGVGQLPRYQMSPETPHMRYSSQVEQTSHLEMQTTVSSTQRATSGQPPHVQQLSPRKRPNQSQRRQMNAGLSLSLESTASVEKGNPSTSTQGSTENYLHNTAASTRQLSNAPTAFSGDSGQPRHSTGHPSSKSSFRQNSYTPGTQHRGLKSHYNHAFDGRGYHGAAQERGIKEPWPNVQQPQLNKPHDPSRPPYQQRQLYQPVPYGGNLRSPQTSPEQVATEAEFLNNLVQNYLPSVGVDDAEINEKEHFRADVEKVCQEVITKFQYEELNNKNFFPHSVQLRCFGSMASGFATKASDMDLALLAPQSKFLFETAESPIPRLIEKALLERGWGARLLTRTRVPIIKLCQKPPKKLIDDLLEEHMKWENGFHVDGGVDDSADNPNKEVASDLEEVKVQDPQPTGDLSKRSPEELYQERLASLHQNPGLSLGDYYGVAKRLLRQLGGRDIGQAYSTLPTAKEVEILVDVNRAFVHGLNNVSLKERLLACQSLTFTTEGDIRAAKSLSGVFNQVEGERLAMMWDSRPLSEATEQMDMACAKQIGDWKILLDRTKLETSFYNRQLHHAVDKLKKIPSLQLVFLEQEEHEDADQYCARVLKLMDDLKVKDVAHNGNSALAIFTTHYINGARYQDIRQALDDFRSRHWPLSLKSLSLHHRMLELARDFEKALNKNLYKGEARSDVEAYLALLRSSPPAHENADGTISSPISANDDVVDLLKKIVALPDPTGISKPRDRYSDHLEFPKSNAGVQCDINFAADLALHNTLLLRCYSLTDTRVRPMILFIKYWAKRRGINTPYRGTLSSYGYVLMVLHYLVNIAKPFVCPNLQHLSCEPPPYLPPAEIEAQTICQGHDVRFWRNEKEIADLAQHGMLNHNTESIGALLRGFFEYYAQNGPMSTGTGRGFDWGREVLSLRTMGGILTKQEKGWVGARTVTEVTHESVPPSSLHARTQSSPMSPPANITVATDADGKPTQLGATQQQPIQHAQRQEIKEVRHRYLFAIEDPFETDHNVARTVTHNGIVSIRDEFRRAWRMIKAASRPPKIVGNLALQEQFGGGLCDEVVEEKRGESSGLLGIMKRVHGDLGELGVENEADAEVDRVAEMHVSESSDRKEGVGRRLY